MNLKSVIKPDGSSLQWKGVIPDEISILAPFVNVFASEKNLNKWMETVEDVFLEVEPEFAPVNEPMKPEDGPVDYELAIDFTEYTKAEVAKYALQKHELTINPKLTKVVMIQELEDYVNGLHV